MSASTGENRPATRFQPGRSGNPAGRPKGARNKATLIAEAKLEAKTGDIIEVQLDRAPPPPASAWTGPGRPQRAASASSC